MMSEPTEERTPEREAKYDYQEVDVPVPADWDGRQALARELLITWLARLLEKEDQDEAA